MFTAVTHVHAHWPSTNVTKWVQYPDRRGYDVLAASSGTAGSLPLIVADDFQCRKSGPITDIHIWASWLGDNPKTDLPITLGIWSDIPAITNVQPPVYSRPGSLLWSQTFGPGQYAIKAWGSGDEKFYNPDAPPPGILGPDKMIWQYNFYPTNPFVQQGSPNAPVVYWLSVTARTNIALFGWKTSTNHWNDDGVYGHIDPAGGVAGDWKELRDPLTPANPRSLDLAFALTTRDIPTNPPPPTNKWVQYPQILEGLDVRATRPLIVADDFLCTFASTITNIVVWGSWLNDQPDTGTRFILGIWSDIPAGGATGANIYSRPGTLLWTETFGPGGYGMSIAGTGIEQFYNPETGQLDPENQIWRFTFVPKKPFCQKGSTNSPTVHWLSVHAITANTNFVMGWKTSTNHWNDDGVWGHVTATGTPVGDWRELHDPRFANLISLDLAFQLTHGPPSADCDPHRKPKFVQWPDPTTNGLDVKATIPKILADDFLCRRPSRINGITIWGSWLQDRINTNTVFTLGLWTDIPAQPGTTNSYSRPGQLLCKQTFLPPQAVGTSLHRYNYRLDTANVLETWYDPNLPGTNGFLGTDTQIWRYDFYPRLDCWRQVGSPTAPRVYWISVVASNAAFDAFMFGWKTSTNHWNDDGVFGHVDAAGNPANDWKELRDPRSGKSLDLSFMLRDFPIVGINKDLRNTMAVAASGVRIVVAGIHEITWHYDDAPPWPMFSVTYVAGNTVLTWSGKVVAPAAITHVGFEMAGSSLTILSMSWLNAAGIVIGTPVQVNHHTWGNGSSLTLNNDIIGAPVGVLPGAMVEFFADPVPLDQMNPGGMRNPIGTADLPVQPGMLMPGGAMHLRLPPALPGAQYQMILMNLADAQGMPATMDFVQLPLDQAIQPIFHMFDPIGSQLMLGWPTVPDRTYRVQKANRLADSFFDIFTDLSGDGEDMMVTVPLGGSEGYYRIALDPL